MRTDDLVSDLVSTSQAASLLGIKRSSLLSILSRHPQIRPDKRVQFGRGSGVTDAYLWSESDIERVRVLRNSFRVIMKKEGSSE